MFRVIVLFATLCCYISYGANTPIILSSQVRANDPTVLDVVYKVTSDKNKVNVRALAFEDGERSFLKVVRPETFVDGTAANIGDNITANIEHKLSWKVSSDWATDLAKVKFEILCSDQGKLPLDLITIPAANRNSEITISYNSQSTENVFNALMWYYANGEGDLSIDDGCLYNEKDLLASRDIVSHMGFAVNYIFRKMGYERLSGVVLDYAAAATRKSLYFNTEMQHGVTKESLKGDFYVGERAYCVIDVSGGDSVDSFPVTYLDYYPIAGWGDEYKTAKILLRRIEPGEVKVANIKPVVLTKPFYIGVFEVTRSQYELVKRGRTSFNNFSTAPKEGVSWNEIRGSGNWPKEASVDQASFIGILRAKTGLTFDLPTEAQWEYACRAGITNRLSNGASTNVKANLMMLGKFKENISDVSSYGAVGSYLPNVWGLYDMYGSVAEWCLDNYGDLNSDLVFDWVGPSNIAERVIRGGSRFSTYESYAERKSKASHYSEGSSNTWSTDYYGFRCALTLSE